MEVLKKDQRFSKVLPKGCGKSERVLKRANPDGERGSLEEAMAVTSPVYVGEFRVEVPNEQLWRGHAEVAVPPRVFALLRYLVERPHQLVTKGELFQALWPGIAVGDAVLTVAVGELRKALGDIPQTPRFIETVHRRGYRFVAPVTTTPPTAGPPGPAAQARPGQEGAVRQPRASQIVGRTEELRQLHHAWEQAQGGARQLLLVTGEPGIGKTTVVETFVEELAAHAHFWLGQGQCIEHYGVGEAYLPVLDALGQLCRGTVGERVIELLRQYAPTWLGQLPGVVAPTDLEALQRLTLGVTRERMLREMAEALEAMSAHRPLVLVLEDLQWCDASTVELLAFVARRRQSARLLVVGTYRPVEVILREHPLKGVKQELEVHGHCQEVALGVLAEAAVREYLTLRFPAQDFPALLAPTLQQRTEGNPLFLENLMQDWVRQGVLAQVQGRWTFQGDLEAVGKQVPESLRTLIEHHLGRLSAAERQLLEVASVGGEEFSAALVAAGLDASVVEVEAACESLARREYLLQGRGTTEWPDGTVATRYGFEHALYREVLSAQIPAARRIQLHQRLAVRLEAAYGGQAAEIAAELAVHFEQGRNYAKAIQYREQAAQRALGRNAWQEAIRHATTGLTLLAVHPETPERWQQELSYQLTLATAFRVTKGYGAEETVQALLRAGELCQQLEAIPQLFLVQLGLMGAYIIRADYQTARVLGEQLVRTAKSERDSLSPLPIHMVMGIILLLLGELGSARSHLEQGIALYSPQAHGPLASLFGQDFGVTCLMYGAWVLWLLGYPDQALRRTEEARTLASELAHPFSRALALSLAALIHSYRREERTAREQSEEAIALSLEQGFLFWLIMGTAIRGRTLARQGQHREGLAQLHQSLADNQTLGIRQGRPMHLGWLAEAYCQAGQAPNGLTVLAEALSETSTTGERVYEAELHRLKGELFLKRTGRRVSPRSLQEVEECFLKAIKVARLQSAKSLELRAVVSLSRLWQQQGKKAESRQMLAEIYGWFTEGFETKDLQEAKALLAELA
jgi:predicted ATPase/DNA-binding winged helix-turn-helix (wHTH) protein